MESVSEEAFIKLQLELQIEDRKKKLKHDIRVVRISQQSTGFIPFAAMQDKLLRDDERIETHTLRIHS